MVRIRLPPEESPQTIGSAGNFTASFSGSYCDALERLVQRLVRVYARALGLPATYFDGPFTDFQYKLRKLYYDEQRKCAFGSCDARTLQRLKDECLRDGGRP
jgi:isopenicillin N synthase-like dioxygenase